MHKKLLILIALLFCFCSYTESLLAQVRLQVRVQSGNAGTQCTDGFLGGAPDPQWRVNILNDGWTTYPRSGVCFQNTPNTQFDREYLCASDMPTQVQVCFRAFEDDGAACLVDEDCTVTQCMNFPTPAPGSSTTHTITIPNNGTNRSWGSVTFTISTPGAFTLPGFANDKICDAIDLGILNSGSSLGNSNLSNYGNFCASSTGDPQPSWNNEQGVWFKFTTSSTPGSVIKIEGKNDPQNRGDQIDLQLALYRSSNNTCSGTLTRIASEHTLPLYSEDMSVNCLLPNTTYYILVDGNNNGFLGGQEGFFGLQVYDDGILQAGDRICDAEFLGQVPNAGRIGTPALRRSNVCATNTGDPNPGVWTSAKSVWFSFRAPASGNVIIEANSDNPAPLGTDAVDLQLAIYSTDNNTCNGNLQYIDGGYNPLGFDEDLNVRCLDSGRIYWVLVNGSALNRDGIFDISVRDGGIPPAPNDEICNAIALGQPIPNGTVRRNNQNNFCADNIFEPIPRNWGNDQGVWYTFIAPPSGKVEIRGRSQGIFGDAIDMQLAVYDSDDMTCTGNLTELTSKHSGIGLLWDEDMEVECLTPGRTYFLLVDGEGSALDPDLQEGIFDIIVYGDPRDTPSPYDNICNAFYMGNPQNGTIRTGPGIDHGSQNNFCATTQANEPNPSGFTPRQTVWYSFTAPSTGNVRIKGNSDAEIGGVDAIDLQIAIWESTDNTCNGTFREIQSGDDLLFDFNIEVYCLDPGRTYFIQIDGGGPEILGGREGYFDLEISTLSPIPVAANNLICDAIDMGNPFIQGTRTITNQHNLCADNLGDPNPSEFTPRQTVWYTFQTPNTGSNYAVVIDATSSLPWPFGNKDAIDLQLAVYASSNNSCTGALTEIASEYDLGFFDETVTVQCLEPGRTYYVMVNGSILDRQGYFDLSIRATTSVPIASNDNICDHIDLGAVPVGGRIQDNIDYYNFCASTERGEPSPFTIDKTVWFSFIAPNHIGATATANVRVIVESDPSNRGNNIDLQLAVYESSDNSCTGRMRRLEDADPLLSRDAEVDLTCLYPGRRYWIQVDGSLFDTDGYFRIRVIDRGSGDRPLNNDMCNPVALGQVPSGGRINNNINYHNLCSDIQAGEPRPNAFDIEQTVWFTFQAPASGNATVEVFNDPNNVGNQIDLQLAVYRALSCNGPFIEIDSRHNPFGFDENISLECLIPGETYYVQVDGAAGGALGGEEGYFTIRVKDDGGSTNFPYNNNICDAYDFGIPTGTRSTRNNEDNYCANVEFSEPGIGNYAERTVWYKFTAPTSARVRIRVKANRTILGIDPEVYLFESSNNTCSGSFRRLNSSNWPTSLVTETIEESCLIPGNVYFIQVDGSGIGQEGTFTIDIEDMEPLYATGQAGDPEPINNYCNNALAIPIQSSSCANGTGTFNTYNYGQPTISYNPSYAQNCNQNCGDTWYYFDMPASGIVNVEGLDDNIGGSLLGDFSNLTVVAYTGTCNNLTPMQCGRGGFSNDVGFELTAAPGTRVYLQVFNNAGDDEDENYQLCVSEGCGADHCLTALANPILPNILYCFNTAGATSENVASGAPGYFECGENDNPEHSLYYYFISDCNGSDVTISVINARSSGSCILGITPTDGFNISFFQDATPCDNNPDALVDCQNFSSCMVQPINWSKTYTNLMPNTPYIIQIDGGFGALGGNNSGEIMITTTTNHTATPIVTPPSCDSNNGIATVDINGGVAPFTFQWSNGSTDSILNNLAEGTYTVTVTGANGCEEITTVEVPSSVGGNLVAIIDNVSNPSCHNACDGQATVVGSTGRPPYTYIWSNGQSTATASGLCAGDYQVTISDNSSCFQVTAVTLSNPSPLVASIDNISHASCINCDGSATVQASGGVMLIDYSYTWSDGNGFATANNLCAGIHTVTITDHAGCAIIESVTITQPSGITASLVSSTNIACYGEGNASIEVIAENGVAPYMYQIDTILPSQNTPLFTNLNGGNYNITITDANGCRTFVPVTIQEPNELTTILVSSIDPSCHNGNDGAITVLTDEFTGTSPYTYSIDGTNYQPSGLFENLSAGTYSIITKDANNCTTTTNVTLVEPDALNITIANQTTTACGICNASADIFVTGGTANYSFVWSSGETTQNASALCAGTAQVTVTDDLGCTAISTLVIENNANFSATATIVGAITCAQACDGQINISTTNGIAPFHYAWSNGANTANASGLCAGIYTVTITDANNCITGAVAELIEPSALSTQTNLVQASACFGANDALVSTQISGGTAPYNYAWSNGEHTTTATVSAGWSYVTITDANQCTLIDSIQTISPSPIQITIDNITPSNCDTINCTGGALANVSGGNAPYTYNWDNGENTMQANTLCAGIHTITVTDNNGCIQVENVVIPTNTSLSIDTIILEQVACLGENSGSALAQVSGGLAPYNYSWSNGETTAHIQNLVAGTYSLTVTDANRCTENAIINIQEPQALTLSLENTVDYNGFDVSCTRATDANIQSIVNGGTAPYSYLWSDHNINANLNNIGAGTYALTVTDANACIIVANITLIEPQPLNNTLAIVSNYNGLAISCFGANDAQVNSNIQGGVAPYAYTWSNGENTATASALGSGLAQVTISDANGCTLVDNIQIIEPSAVIIDNFNIQDALCFGAASGSGEVIVSGGLAPYTYTWSNANTNALNENLTQGNYIVTATDINGCFVIGSMAIGQPNNLVLDNTTITPTCFGQSNGSIQILAQGGTAPYQYIWNTGETNTNLQNIGAGIYEVTVSDANNCSITQSITMLEYPALNIQLTSNNISCAGLQTGNASVNVTGGLAPYSYAWSSSPLHTQSTVNNLSAGAYTVTINDANQCTYIENFTIVEPDALNATIEVISNYNGSQISCPQSNDGIATVTVTGGIAPYQYHWITGATTATITGLQASNYPITITDANGCSIRSTVSITPPSVLSLQTNIISNYNGYAVSCADSFDGSVEVIASGGTGTYQYLWSDGSTQAISNNLGLGVYSVTVTDINGCIVATTDSLSAPEFLSSTFISNNADCFGASTGSANILVTGGMAPYNYYWFDGSTQAQINNLSMGQYTVTVSDNNGCTHINTVSISEPSLLTANINTIINTLCANSTDGSMQVEINGGTMPYQSILWSNGETRATIQNLAPDTYTVTVTDANLCIAVAQATILSPSPIHNTFNIHNGIDCYDSSTGDISVEITGGIAPYTYTWSNGANSARISNLNANTYKVTITDANGCTFVDSIILTAPNPLTAIATISSNYNGSSISCNGAADGAATVYASGGTAPYNYYWLVGQNTATVTGLTRGIYNVQVTDANGCMATTQISINDPLPIEIGAEITAISCNGANNGAISIIPQQGAAPYTYQWSNGATSAILTNLPPNTYQVTATDANGCTATWMNTLVEPFSISLGNVFIQNESCLHNRDGAIGFDSIGGGTAPYHIQWSNNNIGLINRDIAAGDYVISITDANGCMLVDTVTVGRAPQMAIEFINVRNVVCSNEPNGSATIVFTQHGLAPYTYQWSNGFRDSIAQFLQEGLNSVTVTDSRGCSVFGAINITNPNPLSINITSTDISCNGFNNGSANATVNGGTMPYSYAWSNGDTSAQISNLAPNNMYRLTVTDANGCIAYEHIYLHEPTGMTGTFAQVENINCYNGNDGKITLNVVGGTIPYQFAWSNTRTGSHHFTHTISNLSAGNYNVTVTDNRGCYIILDTTLTEPSALSGLTTHFPATCHMRQDGMIQAFAQGGTAPYLYAIDGGSYSNESTFRDLAAGIYTVRIMDANQCIYTLPQVRISSPDSIVLQSSNDAIVRMGDTTHMWVRMPINAPMNPRVQWSPSTGLSCDTCYHTIAQPFQTTTYTVTITGDDDCPSTSSVTISVEGKIDIYVPNAFTPNGDGINDIFMIYGKDGMAIIEEMIIFDRWGEIVFAIKDAPINFSGYGWDGTFKNKPMNPGVFVYVAKIRYLDGSIETVKGDVTLLR